jgi:thioredoxin-like negative regulator of GroEL
MTVAPRDLRVYRAWVEAWLSYTEKNKKVPEGKDSSGTSYDDTVEKIFNLLRPGKLVKQDPVLLIDLLRMASFNEMDDEIDKIQIEVAKIDFYDEHEKILLKMSDELVDFGRGRIVANILESAVNQLPNNYNLSLKLAQVYLEMNPAASVRICEEVMEQNPDLIRAFILWCDAMNLAGRGGEAISELVKRLSDESLNEVVKRQLNQKLETLRMQGTQETPYVATPKREEGMSFNEDPENTNENNDLENNNDNIEDNLEKDNPENTDINSFIPSVVDGIIEDIDF